MRCLSLPVRTTPGALPDSLCPLIEAVGTAAFPGLLFQSVTRMLDAEAGAVYSFGADGIRMRIGHWSPDRPELAGQTEAYAGRYASRDPARHAARADHVVTTCMERAELPDPGHRALLEEAGFGWRIVTLFPSSGGGWYSLNALRPGHSAVPESALDAFSRAAPVYGSLISRHLAAGSLGARLASLSPHLTPRESAVCEGLLRGRNAAAIAESLGIRSSSVHTYRKRAYAKLGVSTLRELFARLI